MSRAQGEILNVNTEKISPVGRNDMGKVRGISTADSGFIRRSGPNGY